MNKNTSIKFNPILMLFLAVSVCQCSEWNYDTIGPDEWVHAYASCRGAQQSPINIETSIAKVNIALAPINFNYYDQIVKLNITNNGHTIISYQFNDSDPTWIPFINGSDFKEPFYLSQFHFHWGYNIYQGSEHYIDDEKYPLEVHLVHRSASNKTAVLGVLFKISQENNTKLDSFMNLIGQDALVDFTETGYLNLSSLIPEREEMIRDGYFRYMGSLTTPPCTEGVVWTVLNTKMNISESQLANFHKNQVKFNDRESQKLNNRTLYVSPPKDYKIISSDSYSSATRFSKSLFINSILFILDCFIFLIFLI